MGDVRFDNAVIWTGNPPRPTKGWLTVRGGLIDKVGTDSPLPSQSVRDLKGQHILPGFVDAHSHLTVSAWLPRTLDGSRWLTAADLLADLEREAALPMEGAWLLATHADFDQFQTRLPTPDDLDRASGGRPVLIADFSLHRSLLSSKALAALTANGMSPSSDFDRRSGRATGMVWESDHAAAFRLALDSLSRTIDDHGRAALLDLEAERHLACGITACHDPCVALSLIEDLEALRKRSPLKLSWSMVAQSGMLDPADSAELCGCCGDGPSSAKLFVDGAHRCALCLEPGHVLQMMARAASAVIRGDLRPIARTLAYKTVYRAGKFHMPYMRFDAAELTERLSLLSNKNVRPRIHAVGNEAATTAADALADSGCPGATLEHLTFLSRADIDRVARSSAVASMQPGFLDRFGADILDRGMTPRLHAYPMGSLRKAGVAVALSSDNPCGPLPPLANIRSAVHRTLPDGRIIDGREALTLDQAIEGYTTLGHQAIHGHTGRGITPGAAADLAILSEDPLAPTSHVTETWIDGNLVWRSTRAYPW